MKHNHILSTKNMATASSEGHSVVTSAATDSQHWVSIGNLNSWSGERVLVQQGWGVVVQVNGGVLDWKLAKNIQDC